MMTVEETARGSLLTRIRKRMAPPPATGAGLGAVSQVLSGIVALATAAAGVIGTITGDLTLLLRNNFALTITALICGFVLMAFATYWALRPRDLSPFFFGLGLVTLAGVCLMAAKFDVQDNRVRPTVTAGWSMVGSSPALKIAAEADDVPETHALWVGVTSSEGSTLYTGATGPGVDGKTKQSAQVVVPNEARGPVTIAAAIVEKENSPVDGRQMVRCFGEGTAIAPAQATPSASPSSQNAPQAACLALTDVPGPAPTAT
ncbi:hypothetical protein ACFUTV_40840 [Streptomyces sp. NPDC057298]|uniref:hypothetical protein n=1 Tax=Streptomyces sp. NPDC057298 TaxID=3346091 RepID=UPI0036257759